MTPEEWDDAVAAYDDRDEWDDWPTNELPPATVPGEGLHSWESQVRQYPKVGAPGIRYESHNVAACQVTFKPTGRVVYETRVDVDCLLYRNHKGHLIGILNHYPQECWDFDGTLLEQAGNVNLWVRPDRRRRGIGLKLLNAATMRWDIDWTQQRYTEAGRALATKLLARMTPLLCGIGGCRLPKDHPGAPDYGHIGRSCGHIECADEHGHIDTCLIEGNDG